MSNIYSWINNHVFPSQVDTVRHPWLWPSCKCKGNINHDYLFDDTVSQLELPVCSHQRAMRSPVDHTTDVWIASETGQAIVCIRCCEQQRKILVCHTPIWINTKSELGYTKKLVELLQKNICKFWARICQWPESRPGTLHQMFHPYISLFSVAKKVSCEPQEHMLYSDHEKPTSVMGEFSERFQSLHCSYGI